MSGPASSRPGRIVFLNGPSSSGKSLIARQLLEILDPPWLHRLRQLLLSETGTTD